MPPTVAFRPLLRTAALLTVTAVAACLPASAAAQGGTSDLLMDKAGPATTAADADITYTLTVTNVGPDASDAVTVTDDLPADTTFVSLAQTTGPAFACADPGVGAAGTVSCTTATLAAGASASFSLVVHTDPGLVPAGFVTNIARVTTAGYDPTEENDEASTAAFVTGGTSADVGVSVAAPDKGTPDSDVPYEVRVHNLGPDAAPVVLTDVLPGDLTFVSLTQTSGPAFSCTTPAVGANGTVSCSVGSLASGGSATFRLVAHVPPGTVSGTEYTNSPTVATTATDPDADNDVAGTTLTVSEADLAVGLTGPTGVTAGETATYAISLVNNGPDAASQTSVFVQLPGDTTFVSFTQDSGLPFAVLAPQPGQTGTVIASRDPWAAGQTATFTLVLRVDADAPDGPLVSVARTEQSTADPDAGNDAASRVTTIEALPTPPPEDPGPTETTPTTPTPPPSTPVAPPATSATPSPSPSPAPPRAVCRSTRTLRFTLARRRGLAPRRVTVAIDGRVVRRHGPRLRVTASLVGRTAGRYRVEVSARYRDGKLVRRTSTVSTCID